MSDRVRVGVLDDPAVVAEVERLLARRTRDIRLKGEIKRLFRERIWSQTAKIIRAWMIWVAFLDVLTLALYTLMLPRAVALSMLLPGAIIPPAVVAVVLVWRKPRAPWLQGATLIASMFFILLSVALVGVSAGGEFYERHLNIMLFVAITAIIIFSVPLTWTVTTAAMALGLYLVFQLQNPGLEIGSAVAATLFFASGILATVAARRTMTILAHKTFLLELRDRHRIAELAKAHDRVELLARTDPLTGVANRRWMTETLDWRILSYGPDQFRSEHDGRRDHAAVACYDPPVHSEPHALHRVPDRHLPHGEGCVRRAWNRRSVLFQGSAGRHDYG